jgi:PDZ domain-containing secreted protein
MEPKKKSDVWHIRLENIPSNYTESGVYDSNDFDNALMRALLHVVNEIAIKEEQAEESEHMLDDLERLDDTVQAEHLPDTEQLILNCYRKYQDE